MLGRAEQMETFSQRQYYLLYSSGSLLVTDIKERVHWWPGDRTSTKDWTQWDEDGFNSGVAGPFLAYAAANSESYFCMRYA